jgi:uncharacterized protein
MNRSGTGIQLSATDLVGYLDCRHLSALDRAVAEGALAKPTGWNPQLDVLRERGLLHEQRYVEHLAASGLDIIRIEGVDVTPDAVAQTQEAMRLGTPVIVQGALSNGQWSGRADILLRVDTPSQLGAWSYEPTDTKLSRETRAGAILQLCVYADLLAQTQGRAPEHMHIVAPWTDFKPHRYRFDDFGAFFRRAQQGLATSVAAEPAETTYPDPTEHCDVCRWRDTCDKRRRADHHLCLVAGISKVQINELKGRGVATAVQLATLSLPLPWKPERGAIQSYVRIREQARIQVAARESGERTFELLPVEAGFGLTRLPPPSDGDIFLDLEGDPFVGEHGLEYLFGYLAKDAAGVPDCRHLWAFSRADERRAFETFVDAVMERWTEHPDLHVYHYAPYEPAALKRLMGRYATREEQIDQMLRAGLFVDLYQVVRHALRASVESYSIKQLESFYGFERGTPLAAANTALAALEAHLELDEVAVIAEDTWAVVAGYNADDCRSTSALRDWLEGQRSALVASGVEVPRPVPGDGAPKESISDWLIRIGGLIERLTTDVPADAAERTPEQHGRWLLAHILDWHRREQKAVWWEYFRLEALSVEDLLDERAGLSGLTYVETVGGTARAPIHRYRFPSQETDLRGGEALHADGGAKFGSVDEISFGDLTIDIKKRQDTADTHARAIFAHDVVDSKVLAESLARIAEHVVAHGLEGEGPYQAARDLLLRTPPRTGGEPLTLDGETPLTAALRLCGHLAGVLPIQGPPGAGKTYVGANMIVELVRLGKTVGITANSHKVIRHLIDETIKVADEKGVPLECCHKAANPEDARHRLSFAKRNQDLLAALTQAVQVGGGTAWLWASPDAADTLDVLFVDEAAQMSFANVLAVSVAAKTVVLIGDPRQLDQPMQGSHPDGTDVSALDHILDGLQTISADRGLFLGETWRLHPSICAFTSELFYEGKLTARAGLERMHIKGGSPLGGSGLCYLPVAHSGNQNCSPEEARAIKALVERVLADSPTWIDREGVERPVTFEDIVIVAPYNAQVFEIQQLLPDARVGTVDKFQGQEAPIAIYSMATSSHADAPRGMEFLYSLNRLNVATSRAKCVSVLICSPQVLEAECHTPRQLQLANAFCRYLEMARCVDL